jgi:hypothetical protein
MNRCWRQNGQYHKLEEYAEKYNFVVGKGLIIYSVFAVNDIWLEVPPSLRSTALEFMPGSIPDGHWRRTENRWKDKATILVAAADEGSWSACIILTPSFLGKMD